MFKIVEFWNGGVFEEILGTAESLEQAYKIARHSSLYGEAYRTFGEEGVAIYKGKEIIETY